MTEESQKTIMVIAVVQALDSDLVSSELDENNFSFAKLPSVGGFLREKDVTFIIGCTLDKESFVHDLLLDAAKKRVTFISTPLENGPIPVPVPVESVVGGVKSYSIVLDDFLEI
ncbi:MAG TPA: cyclic-di-AMP receptor [Anaerolineaceae bacterium]|nr:cyclic-di-AMP receptor [Anaerolineaceae bacterium]